MSKYENAMKMDEGIAEICVHIVYSYFIFIYFINIY